MLCEMNPVFACCYGDLVGSGLGDAYIPELWAQESVAILKENLGVANLVHRDFQNEVASYGQVVHTRKPGEFKVKRRTDSTSITPDSASAQDIPVVLNQWFNKTFTIPEGAMSLSFKELVAVYLEPAVLSIARGADRAVLGRLANAYLGTPGQRAGRMGKLDKTTAYDAIVECDQILNVNKAPQEGRSLLLAPNAKATMLKVDTFVKAMERGDGGSTLETAVLGSILGFNSYMFQNVSSVLAGADTAAHTVTEPYAAEYAGTQASAGVEGTATAGEFMVVPGNDQPTWITALGTDVFTLNEPNKYATGDNAVAVRYKKCAASGNYGAGWSEDIVVGGFTAGKSPQVGQLIAFGTGASRRLYTIIEATVAAGGATSAILLDRPLEVSVASSDAAFPGPMGTINVAMHRNALALVTRPLASTHAAGIEFGVSENYGLGMRVAMQHVINQGLVVAVDMLAGVAVLDSALCVPLLG